MGIYSYYDSKEFWDYLESYACFVKKYRVAIDLFANVDVIGNPELTYRNQKYLEEKHGLLPVPVVHYKTDLLWLRRYMKEGYSLIGVGGLVGRDSPESKLLWLDRVFDLVCTTPNRCPEVKLHGFGVTSYDLLIRYPWSSVDSSSWTKIGAFGGVLVPHKREGEFIFTETPYVIKTSVELPSDRHRRTRKAAQGGLELDTSLAMAANSKHYLALTKPEQAVVNEWLEVINIPLGRVGKQGSILHEGVLTTHALRKAANLHFFERMCASLPAYPWPFVGGRGGFGL